MTDYADEKSRSEALDLKFGFAIATIEMEVAARLARDKSAPQETWNHLSPQSFQTPYPELERIIADADPESEVETWADLGAAYGRLGIVLALRRPDARFVGVEIVPERVKEGRRIFARLGLNPETLVCADLEKCPLPEADLYFIYDFGKRAAIDHVLDSLRERARTRAVRVVGRGRGIRDAIEHDHPWLGEIVDPVHTAHYSIYRSAIH